MKMRLAACFRVVVAWFLAVPLLVLAQTPGIPRIGVLLFAAEPAPGQPNPMVDALRGGLRDLGYVEGKNLVLDFRWTGGSDQRAAENAADLVTRKVAVIVSVGTPTTVAAVAATKTIPIVMTSVGDPVASGFVTSLARPGANVTGLSMLDESLDTKRIELLKSVAPGTTRIAMLWSPDDPGMALAFGRVESASRDLRVGVNSLAVHNASELADAAQAPGSPRPEALFVTAQPFTVRHQAQILDVANKLGLPAMYTDRRFVDAGGLMSYGPTLFDMYRRTASYVDRILRGAKPADLPVEQPTKFELVINLRAANSLGLAIPPTLLMRADEVIQ
jgi:putative ABC transport system substrate-binding protein